MGDKGMSRNNRNHIIVPNDPPMGPPILVDIALMFLPPFGTLLGIYFLLKRGKAHITRRQYRDFRHYAAIIGDRASVSIREIATRLGKSTDEVVSDLQQMIENDILDAKSYIDRNALMLHLSEDIIETSFVNATVDIPRETTRRKKPTEEGSYTAPKASPAMARPEAAKPAPAPKKEQSASQPKAKEPRKTGVESVDFEAKLREIRQLNDDIDNELVSERIDRIGTLTASIFRVVQEKPERAEEVRKFMNYYLPTTLKLLKSYSLMEKQSYQGENIVASRKKIEDVLETLVRAFEQQQDKLFQSDALDVETDISVLETMMSMDGLNKQQGSTLQL